MVANRRRKWTKSIKKRALSFDEILHPMKHYSGEGEKWGEQLIHQVLRSDLYLAIVTFGVKNMKRGKKILKLSSKLSLILIVTFFVEII